MRLYKIIKRISTSWRYLIAVSFVYVFFLIFDYDLFIKSLVYCGAMASEVVQAFLLVFVLMVLGEYFITPEFITKYLEKSPLIKWVGVVVGGIVSTGPIYMWYPLMADLRKKVLDNGMVACFLYNRAIKIPLIPVALIYFNWKFLLILGLVMVFVSIIQGIIINLLMKGENEICYSS